MKLFFLGLLVVPLVACTRTTSAPTSVATQSTRTPTVAPASARESERQRERLFGESPAEEIMERVEELSPYAGNAQGLEQLVRAIATAAQSNQPAQLDALLNPVMPRSAPLRLALTFEGGRTLVPYLTGPAGSAREELLRVAREWSRAQSIVVRVATGTEIASGANTGAYDPALRRIGSLLRDGVQFYRVELQYPDGRSAASETWVYAGGRWMFLPQPWRFVVGSPERTQTNPTNNIGANMPAGALR